MVVRRRPGGGPVPVSSGTAAAYSATGAAWQQGPARIYDRLAEIVVAALPGAVVRRVRRSTSAPVPAPPPGLAGRRRQPRGGRRRRRGDAGPRRRQPAPGRGRRRPGAALRHRRLRRHSGRLLPQPPHRPGGRAAGGRPGDAARRRSGRLGLRRRRRPPGQAAVQAALAARGWAPEPWYRALQATPRRTGDRRRSQGRPPRPPASTPRWSCCGCPSPTSTPRPWSPGGSAWPSTPRSSRPSHRHRPRRRGRGRRRPPRELLAPARALDRHPASS